MRQAEQERRELEEARLRAEEAQRHAEEAAHLEKEERDRKVCMVHTAFLYHFFLLVFSRVRLRLNHKCVIFGTINLIYILSHHTRSCNTHHSCIS